MSKTLDTAKKLSWAKGTPKEKYAYKGGNPTKEYVKAFRKYWAKLPKSKMTNCDRTLALIFLVALGIKIPTGNEDQLKFKTKKLTVKVYKNKRPSDVAKAGDGVVIKKKKGRHSFMYGGKTAKGKVVIYEAQHNKTYLHRNGNAKKATKKYPKVVIFREKKK